MHTRARSINFPFICCKEFFYTNVNYALKMDLKNDRAIFKIFNCPLIIQTLSNPLMSLLTKLLIRSRVVDEVR